MDPEKELIRQSLELIKRIGAIVRFTESHFGRYNPRADL